MFFTFTLCSEIYTINNIPCFQIDVEDIFHPDRRSLYPEPCDDTPCSLPPLKEDVCPDSKSHIPVNVEKKKKKTVRMITSLSGSFSVAEIRNDIST